MAKETAVAKKFIKIPAEDIFAHTFKFNANLPVEPVPFQKTLQCTTQTERYHEPQLIPQFIQNMSRPLIDPDLGNSLEELNMKNYLYYSVLQDSSNIDKQSQDSDYELFINEKIPISKKQKAKEQIDINLKTEQSIEKQKTLSLGFGQLLNRTSQTKSSEQKQRDQYKVFRQDNLKQIIDQSFKDNQQFKVKCEHPFKKGVYCTEVYECVPNIDYVIQDLIVVNDKIVSEDYKKFKYILSSEVGSDKSQIFRLYGKESQRKLEEKKRLKKNQIHEVYQESDNLHQDELFNEDYEGEFKEYEDALNEQEFDEKEEKMDMEEGDKKVIEDDQEILKNLKKEQNDMKSQEKDNKIDMEDVLNEDDDEVDVKDEVIQHMDEEDDDNENIDDLFKDDDDDDEIENKDNIETKAENNEKEKIEEENTQANNVEDSNQIKQFEIQQKYQLENLENFMVLQNKSGYGRSDLLIQISQKQKKSYITPILADFLIKKNLLHQDINRKKLKVIVRSLLKNELIQKKEKFQQMSFQSKVEEIKDLIENYQEQQLLVDSDAEEEFDQDMKYEEQQNPYYEEFEEDERSNEMIDDLFDDKEMDEEQDDLDEDSQDRYYREERKRDRKKKKTRQRKQQQRQKQRAYDNIVRKDSFEEQENQYPIDDNDENQYNPDEEEENNDNAKKEQQNFGNDDDFIDDDEVSQD